MFVKHLLRSKAVSATENSAVDGTDENRFSRRAYSLNEVKQEMNRRETSRAEHPTWEGTRWGEAQIAV